MLNAIRHIVNQPVYVLAAAIAIEQLKKNIKLFLARLGMAKNMVEGFLQALFRKCVSKDKTQGASQQLLRKNRTVGFRE